MSAAGGSSGQRKGARVEHESECSEGALTYGTFIPLICCYALLAREKCLPVFDCLIRASESKELASRCFLLHSC